ncbi:glycosyltransferase family 61 protein [Nocardioides panacisoli]|uniref:glycosyltransferase family 61 protein n=1 Tax=Nocardioides panacisoli TaxID=627624 RepID=UPI001C62D95E|nr:glycosyltransferase family 61 protein [Nocardioides panacisoli]QYJ03943.1 glycosyltransferase family 61 protein [Nocardioides panacisoli]
MSRIPPRLQPLWPLLKRLHRLLAHLGGVLFRRLGPVAGERAVPRTATEESTATVAGEPDAVTLHAGGPAEELRRGPAVGSPPQHWVFVAGERDTVPARYTLEVTDGRLVGEWGATVTPGGVLDYQSSGYFGLSGWREHPVFLAPRLPPVEHVPGTVLSLTTRGTTGNYYHFLYDALARYGIFRECLPDVSVDAVVVPHAAGYQRQLLELAGVPGPHLQPRADRTYRADRLLVPSTPNQDLAAPHWVTNWLRERLPPSGRTDTPRRLYLSRGQQPASRRYVEEAALWPRLERRGFVSLDPGSLSVQEQIDTFAGAEVILAPHGAGLTNLTFCRPGTKVLELFAATYVHLGLWTIADAVGLDYRYLVADGPSREGRPMVGVLDDVSIPPERVEAALDDLMEDR